MIRGWLRVRQEFEHEGFFVFTRQVELPFLPPTGFGLRFAGGLVELRSPPVWEVAGGRLLLWGDFTRAIPRDRAVRRARELWKHGFVLVETFPRGILDAIKYRKFYESEDMTRPAYVSL